MDYSNMEVRVFAEVAQDPVMLDAIRRGENLHTMVANRIWGGVRNHLAIRQAVRALVLEGAGLFNDKITALHRQWGIRDPRRLTPSNRHILASSWLESFNWDIVKAEYSIDREYTRTIGKMVTFLKIYGGWLKAARKLLKDENKRPLPDEELIAILNAYDEGMPRIEEFSRECIDRAEIDGFVETLWGRKLTISSEYSYRAVNYLVQGSSADLLKSRMIETDKYLTSRKLDAHLALTIHDELVFEINKQILTRQLVGKLQSIMEDSGGKMSINMPVDPKIVWKNWGHKEKLKEAA